jgi:hypothetical protein
MLRRAPSSLVRQLLAGEPGAAAAAGGLSQQLQRHLPSQHARPPGAPCEPWHLPAALPAARPWPLPWPRLGHSLYSSAPAGGGGGGGADDKQQPPDKPPGEQHDGPEAEERLPAEEPPSLPPLHPNHEYMREHGNLFHRLFDEGGAARWARMGRRAGGAARCDAAAPAAAPGAAAAAAMLRAARRLAAGRRRTESRLDKSEWLQLLPHPVSLLTMQLGLRLRIAAQDLLRQLTSLRGSHADKLRGIEESLQVSERGPGAGCRRPRPRLRRLGSARSAPLCTSSCRPHMPPAFCAPALVQEDVEEQFNMAEFSAGCGDAVTATLQNFGAADWEALEGMVSEEMMATMRAQHEALAATDKFEVGARRPAG